MKLKDVLRHTPVNQKIKLIERLHCLCVGLPDSQDIQEHADKQVGIISVRDGSILVINVYDKK